MKGSTQKYFVSALRLASAAYSKLPRPPIARGRIWFGPGGAAPEDRGRSWCRLHQQQYSPLRERHRYVVRPPVPELPDASIEMKGRR